MHLLCNWRIWELLMQLMQNENRWNCYFVPWKLSFRSYSSIGFEQMRVMEMDSSKRATRSAMWQCSLRLWLRWKLRLLGHRGTDEPTSELHYISQITPSTTWQVSLAANKKTFQLDLHWKPFCLIWRTLRINSCAMPGKLRKRYVTSPSNFMG